MVEIIFSALFTLAVSGLALSAILGLVGEYKNSGTLLAHCLLVSLIFGTVILAGFFIYIIWVAALAQ